MLDDSDPFAQKVGWWLFFCAIFYFLMRWLWPGDFLVNHGLMLIIYASLGICVGKLAIWISRYYMGHLVCNGVVGSILGDPSIIREGNGVLWAVFNLGESLDPIHFRGKLATCVLPWKQLKRVGKSYISVTFVQKWPTRWLPPNCYKFVTNNEDQFNTDQVYFGYMSEEYKHKNLALSENEEYVHELYSQINLRNDLLRGRNDEIIELKTFADEMTGGSKWDKYKFWQRSPEKDRPREEM